LTDATAFSIILIKGNKIIPKMTGSDEKSSDFNRT
jgi:hypothetical protein